MPENAANPSPTPPTTPAANLTESIAEESVWAKMRAVLAGLGRQRRTSADTTWPEVQEEADVVGLGQTCAELAGHAPSSSKVRCSTAMGRAGSFLPDGI